MIANSACLCFTLNQTCYISLCFYLLKTQTSQVSIFHLPQFFFCTHNDNRTNSVIAMQVLFVRHIILEADSGLVKLIVIIKVFFNKQQQKIEIKRFIFVKYIKSRFFCYTWNQCFHSACKTWRSVFTENFIFNLIW